MNSWADGAMYSGAWEGNRLEGWGVFTWPSGRRYEGAFAADRRHGLGVMTVAGGIKSGGRFHNVSLSLPLCGWNNPVGRSRQQPNPRE